MKLRSVTLHESSRFQIIPEYRISDCEMAINTTALLLALALILKRTIGDYITSGLGVLIELAEKKHIVRRSKEWTHDDTRKVGIEDTFLFIVFPMNLQKMRAKIVDNSFIIVGTVAEGCNAEWDSSQVNGKVKLERDGLFGNAHTTG